MYRFDTTMLIICQWTMITLVNLVFWMFAFKYYELSLKLCKILKPMQTQSSITPRTINRFMLINIFVWPLIENIFFAIVASKPEEYSTNGFTFVKFMAIFAGIIEILPLPISCTVTWLAFRRIQTITDGS